MKTTINLLNKKIDEIKEEVKEHNEKLDKLSIDVAIVNTNLTNHLKHHMSIAYWLTPIVASIVATILTLLIKYFGG